MVIIFSLVGATGMMLNHRQSVPLARSIGKSEKTEATHTQTHVLENTSSGNFGHERLPRSFLTFP